MKQDLQAPSTVMAGHDGEGGLRGDDENYGDSVTIVSSPFPFAPSHPI